MPPTGIPKGESLTREKNRRVPKNILELTLENLQNLFKNNPVHPGMLTRLALKPRWNAVLGSNNECGLASNFMGISDYLVDHTKNRKYLELVGKPLFEIADRGIHSADLIERSIGIAAISALSQQFLSPSAVRNRGFLARCWIPGDKLVRQYPTLSRLVTKNDIVTIVGYGNEVRDLRGKCRELHVIDYLPHEAFDTVIIDTAITYGPRDIVVHSPKENDQVLQGSDIVIITASALVNGTFEDIVKCSENARLVGLYGPDASIIPDAFFERGIDFVLSFRVADPGRFSDNMINDHDMEFALSTTQIQCMFMRPLAKTRGTPIQKMLQQTSNPKKRSL
jgi:uncharacterized protein (DUF4213/DUF364 family)